MRALQAKLLLLYQLLIHIYRSIPRLFSKQESQLQQFLLAYGSDQGFWVPTEQERESFSKFSKCIHCGTCELDCHMLQESPGLNFKPSWVAISCTRYTPDIEKTIRVLDVCVNCPGCTVVCPTGVPIKEMAEFVRKKSQNT